MSLLQFDFNDGIAWRGTQNKPVGTIDTAGSTMLSGGLIARQALTSPLLPISNPEANLAKLTLSFSLSVSVARPVTVKMESFDAKKKHTGSLETQIYPAAPDFHQRYALELSTMRGSFKPSDPFVKLTLTTDSSVELRLDNLHYARPALYVSPQGSDTNDGRTERTALATPQRAIDVAQPGDIVLVMNGVYTPHDLQEGVVSFRRPGTPAAWITLKNYPGHTPRFAAVNTWNAIKIGQRGSKDKPSSEPALAYLEVRGLHIRGDSDTAKEKYAQLIGEADARTNGNALSVLGRYETHKAHHIRIADNQMEYCNGGGISGIEADYIQIENNTICNNCWWMIYAGSGISLLDVYNFDATDNVYKTLIRNNTVSGNRCFVPWRQIKKISDGNGIIIDTNYVPAKNQVYLGRTLVQGNLSFNNGGSGIHAFKSHQVDIINNTAYLNGASPELNWGQIFAQVADDIRIVNNILVSRPDQPINSVGKDGGDQKSTRIVRANNLYFGGLAPKLMGEGDLLADPQFVNPSTDPAVANFQLKATSPARKSGRQERFSPLRDLIGKLHTVPPTRGALEK